MKNKQKYGLIILIILFILVNLGFLVITGVIEVESVKSKFIRFSYDISMDDEAMKNGNFIGIGRNEILILHK